MITVYSKPHCTDCNATYTSLDKRKIPYAVIDVSQDAAALKTITDLGYLQVPVCMTSDGDHWSGYRPDKILALARQVAH